MNAQPSMGVTKTPGRSHAYMAQNAEGDDRLLVAEAKSGYVSAFGALYERHRSKIYRVAFRILRNQQDAEDAAQRSFQRGFTSLMRFRGDSSFSTWMTRIAINEALMMRRQKRPITTLPEYDSGSSAHFSVDLSDKRPTPEQVLAQTELQSAVTQAISKLRRNLRLVVLLSVVHGLTSAEIARRLGLTVGAVKARTFHAKRHLRRHLERKFEELMPVSWSGREIRERGLQ